MKAKRLNLLALSFLAVLFFATPPAPASPSHVRIVRLRSVQGEVSFTRSATSDPLSDQHISWETAVANLPIRQGYVVATLQGRAEVEFENGGSAYLAENSILEFYDLSLDDGARITRLVLRQGTASFDVQQARGDFFSVTGADFTAEAAGRGLFRMENFDDGSTIAVRKGRVKIVAKTLSSMLKAGESMTFAPEIASLPPVGQLPPKDEFDSWVSQRSDAATVATASSLTYVSSPYYSSGFADLYSYGNWFNYSGYGYCWRPYGAGLAWSPFSAGQWAFDPWMGWVWVSYEPWGWIPYHFGSWIFDGAYGWIWVPSGFSTFGATPVWRPSTAVWVRSGNTVGIVPLNPLDKRGKTPVNLGHGVISVSGGAIHGVELGPADARLAWKALKSPPKSLAAPAITRGAAPIPLSRTLAGAGGVGDGQSSSIQYDPRERKFVNSSPAPGARRASSANTEPATAALSTQPAAPASVRSSESSKPSMARSSESAPRVNAATPPARSSRATPPPAPLRSYTPPPAPRSSGASPRPGYPRWSSGGSGPRYDRPAPRADSPAPRYSPQPRAEAPAPRPSSGGSPPSRRP